MLYITYKTKESNFQQTASLGDWHVGEPLPKIPMGARAGSRMDYSTLSPSACQACWLLSVSPGLHKQKLDSRTRNV